MADVGTGKTRAADISVCLNSFTGAQTFIGVCGTFAGTFGDGGAASGPDGPS